MRGFWTATAAALVLSVIALSMRMNFEFGYGLGTNEATALIYGALSMAFDGLKALLPLIIAWQLQDNKRLHAAVGAGLFVVLAAYGMASAVGFASHSREGLTASREHLNASLKEHAADLERAEKRLKELGAHRVGGVIEADIAKMKKDRLWDATSGCTDATLSASREFCKRIDTLRAELALAAEDHVLTAKIDGLKFKVRQLRERGAGREADPQLGEIARATGMDLLRVRSSMNWLLAIAVEAVSCFGLFAIGWHAKSKRTTQMASEPRADGNRPWRLVSRDEPGRRALQLLLPGRREEERQARGGKKATRPNRRTKRPPKALPRPRAGERPEVQN